MPTSTVPVDMVEGCVMTEAEKIHKAANWYLNHSKATPRPIVPYLKDKFGISAGQAAKAISKAVEWR